MIPSPHQLFDRFERGEIEREELQSLMALHARELIGEMEEDHQNPAMAWLESRLARRAAERLVRKHGNRLVRESLSVLADLPDFPFGRYLWNASHPDVPVHCFFRMRREPVFRIRSIENRETEVILTVEYQLARGEKPVRRDFILRRDDQWRLNRVRE